MRVLIVDDEPITRMELREILVRAGYEIAGEAADGFDAVELCSKIRPDLVIMDVRMPLLDGIQAARIISEAHTAGTIVLLTAYSDAASVIDAACGVSGCVIKPPGERDLIPAIEIACKLSGQMRKLEKQYECLQRKMEERTLIERAKGILMVDRKISEQEAYAYIRNLSRVKNVPMRKISEVILAASGA